MTQETYSISDYTQAPSSQRVKVVYHVRADAAYQVVRWLNNAVTHIGVLTIAGAGRIIGRRGTAQLPAGSLYFLCADDLRAYGTAETSWEFYWFEFDSDALPFSCDRVYAIGEASYHTDLCDTSLRQLECGFAACASAVFTAAVHLWHAGCADPENDGDRTIVEQAVAYMKAHMREFSVQRLACSLYLSERTLRNLFYRYMGQSPMRTFNQLRMDRARSLLGSSVLPVGDIAEELGYASQFHFSRSFHQWSGVSPSEYRAAVNDRAPRNLPHRQTGSDTRSEA